MEKIKAVIFDFGGVLIDWNPYYLYRKIITNDTEIERFLQEIHFTEWNYNFDQGYPFELGITELCRRFPNRADLIRQFDERWMETLGGTFDANIELVKTLKSQGMPVYGLSNWSSEKFSQVRKQYTFFNLFDDMVISGEVKIAKPDPRIFNLLLEQVKLNASECVFIDDSENNCLAARKVGLQVIQYQSSRQLRRELESRGVIEPIVSSPQLKFIPLS